LIRSFHNSKSSPFNSILLSNTKTIEQFEAYPAAKAKDSDGELKLNRANVLARDRKAFKRLLGKVAAYTKRSG
jgi:hypothetical protein